MRFFDYLYYRTVYMYLNTYRENSGKYMGVIAVSLMQTFHLIFLYIVILNIFHIDRKLVEKYHFVSYATVTLILFLNYYRYTYVKTYESFHYDWLNEVNRDNSHKGWLLVLYIFLNFSLTITFGILTR